MAYKQLDSAILVHDREPYPFGDARGFEVATTLEAIRGKIIAEHRLPEPRTVVAYKRGGESYEVRLLVRPGDEALECSTAMGAVVRSLGLLPKSC